MRERALDVMLNDEPYPGARADLVNRVPPFAQRVLLVGCGCGELALLLKRRGAAEVHGVEWDSLAAQARRCFESVSKEGEPSFPAGYFDCVVLAGALPYVDRLAELLKNVEPSLSPNGYVLVCVPNGQHWKGTIEGSDPETTGRALSEAGLACYTHFATLDPESEGVEPDAEGNILLGGRAYPAASPEARDVLLATDYVFVAVSPTYNPVLHARELFDAGHPDWSYEVLSLIPQQYLETPDVKATVYADMMLCILAMDNRLKDHDRLNRFALSQQLFYEVVSHAPHCHFAYQCQAEFWDRMGDRDMAARLLRSVLHVAPDEKTSAQLERYRPSPSAAVAESAPPVLPEDAQCLAWRILFVTHPRVHYGLDILYDGLCTVLGDDNVLDFPWKPWLHGEIPERLGHYPCTFNRRGKAKALDEVLQRLRDRQFDVVLFGDLEEAMDRDTARRIAETAGGTPFFIVDALDESVNTLGSILDYLGVSSVGGYFKREMIASVDYGPNTFPLPFAYADNRVPVNVPGPRTEDLFWAGHRQFGLRRLYLEHIEAKLGRNFEAEYTQDEYAQMLRCARIGLNIFGKGFDTVRYWELPAHGCMLLSERPPIRIPHDFRDGESAVFFDDMRELEEKLDYYLAHPEEAEVIGCAGYEHLKRHHTGSARARQALGWMQQAIRRTP